MVDKKRGLTAYAAKVGDIMHVAGSVEELQAIAGEYPKQQESASQLKHDNTVEPNQWAAWGRQDKDPTLFREKINKIPVAVRGLNKLIRMAYGNGLVYFKTEDLRQDSKVTRHYDEEIEAFIKRNKIETVYLPKVITNFTYTSNCFSEFIFSKTKNKITGINTFNAEDCRIQKQDEKTLRKEHLYISEYFRTTQANKKNTIQIPLLDYHAELNKDFKIKKHTLGSHTFIPSAGMRYYADHLANALIREDGFADVSIAVPEIIHRMMKNQIALMYMIYIPLSYFLARHKGFDTMTKEQQEKIMSGKIAALNKVLKDPNNQFKSITTIVDDMNHDLGTSGGKIEITPIDDKTKKDAWIPSSALADNQILHGIGIHPSQIGLSNDGGTIGAGSGSDQRESFNTEVTLNTMDQLIMLSDLQRISDYNNWGVTFRFDNTTHTTTNNQENGIVNNPATIEVS